MITETYLDSITTNNSISINRYILSGNQGDIGYAIIVSSRDKRTYKQYYYPTLLDFALGTGSIIEQYKHYIQESDYKRNAAI